MNFQSNKFSEKATILTYYVSLVKFLKNGILAERVHIAGRSSGFRVARKNTYT